MGTLMKILSDCNGFEAEILSDKIDSIEIIAEMMGYIMEYRRPSAPRVYFLKDAHVQFTLDVESYTMCVCIVAENKKAQFIYAKNKLVNNAEFVRWIDGLDLLEKLI